MPIVSAKGLTIACLGFEAGVTLAVAALLRLTSSRTDGISVTHLGAWKQDGQARPIFTRVVSTASKDQEMPRTLQYWLAQTGFAAAIVLTGACMNNLARADDLPTVLVTIKDHRFVPSEIHVPQGKPVVLTIKNEDSTAEEFDSSALKVEKVIGGNNYGTVRLRPLGPGRYPFMGEYHSDTAQGVVISE